MAELDAVVEHIRIAKIIGENEDGISLFVPKDMGGTFEIEADDRFLTLLFIHQVDNEMVAWLPWEN